jgi:hypothetical protein
MVHAQKCGEHTEEGMWASDSDTQFACRGCIGESIDRQPRGAITKLMYYQLFNTLDAQKVPYTQLEHRCFRLIYEGALRRGEFLTLRSGDLTVDQKGRNWVQLHTDKISNTSSAPCPVCGAASAIGRGGGCDQACLRLHGPTCSTGVSFPDLFAEDCNPTTVKAIVKMFQGFASLLFQVGHQPHLVHSVFLS